MTFELTSPTESSTYERKRRRVKAYASTPGGRAQRKRHKRKRRLAKLGWTTEMHVEAMARQGGRCFLCGAKPKTRGLHADHDHVTGRARALLCALCNRYVGCIERYPGLWERLAAYVNPPPVEGAGNR